MGSFRKRIKSSDYWIEYFPFAKFFQRKIITFKSYTVLSQVSCIWMVHCSNSFLLIGFVRAEKVAFTFFLFLSLCTCIWNHASFDIRLNSVKFIITAKWFVWFWEIKWYQGQLKIPSVNFKPIFLTDEINQLWVYQLLCLLLLKRPESFAKVFCNCIWVFFENICFPKIFSWSRC